MHLLKMKKKELLIKINKLFEKVKENNLECQILSKKTRTFFSTLKIVSSFNSNK